MKWVDQWGGESGAFDKHNEINHRQGGERDWRNHALSREYSETRVMRRR